jgi:hypothetical protein
VDGMTEQPQKCASSRPGPKPSPNRVALRRSFPEWSERTFSTFYTACLRASHLKHVGGMDIYEEAINLATRPSGSLNVSKFARIVEARLVFWLLDQEAS